MATETEVESRARELLNQGLPLGAAIGVVARETGTSVEGEEPELDLSDYVTVENLNQALSQITITETTVENIVNETFVTEIVENNEFITNLVENNTFVTELTENNTFVTELTENQTFIEETVNQITEVEENNTYIEQITQNQTFVTQITAQISGKKGIANELATLDGTSKLTASQIPTKLTKKGFSVVIDGGGAVITAGVKARIRMPVAWTDITDIDIIGDHATGDVVLDFWKGTSAEGVAGTIVAGDSICASAKPTVTNARGVAGAATTGWTKTGNALDWLYINVESVQDFTNLTLAFTVVF